MRVWNDQLIQHIRAAPGLPQLFPPRSLHQSGLSGVMAPRLPCSGMSSSELNSAQLDATTYYIHGNISSIDGQKRRSKGDGCLDVSYKGVMLELGDGYDSSIGRRFNGLLGRMLGP